MSAKIGGIGVKAFEAAAKAAGSGGPKAALVVGAAAVGVAVATQVAGTVANKVQQHRENKAERRAAKAAEAAATPAPAASEGGRLSRKERKELFRDMMAAGVTADQVAGASSASDLLSARDAAGVQSGSAKKARGSSSDGLFGATEAPRAQDTRQGRQLAVAWGNNALAHLVAFEQANRNEDGTSSLGPAAENALFSDIERLGNIVNLNNSQGRERTLNELHEYVDSAQSLSRKYESKIPNDQRLPDPVIEQARGPSAEEIAKMTPEMQAMVEYRFGLMSMNPGLRYSDLDGIAPSKETQKGSMQWSIAQGLSKLIEHRESKLADKTWSGSENAAVLDQLSQLSGFLKLTHNPSAPPDELDIASSAVSRLVARLGAAAGGEMTLDVSAGVSGATAKPKYKVKDTAKKSAGPAEGGPAPETAESDASEASATGDARIDALTAQVEMLTRMMMANQTGSSEE